MSSVPDFSLADRLIARFGQEKVTLAADSSEPWNAWYPIAIKRRQGAGNSPSPVAVLLPDSIDMVGDMILWANDNGVELVPIGGASNTVGYAESGNPAATVAIRFSRLNSIDWDETSLSVTAGAGVVLAELEAMLNGHRYTLGSLPQSGALATVGGAIANEMFGLFAAGYGGIRPAVLSIDAVMRNGMTVHTSSDNAITRPLHHLLIGSEGAFGFIASARLAIRPLPEVRAWGSFTFARFDDAISALRLVYRSDARPVCVRLFDAESAKARFPGEVPDDQLLLLFAVEGSEVVQTGHYQTTFAICKQVGGTEASIDGDEWFDSDRYRTDAFAENGRPGTIVDVFSCFSSWTKLTGYYNELTSLQSKTASLSIQIGYCDPHGAALDIRVKLECRNPEDSISQYESFVGIIHELTTQHEVEISHHYGIGASRSIWRTTGNNATSNGILTTFRQSLKKAA